MGSPRNIRFPDELEKAIEAAQIEDGREDFTKEVLYLCKLGLEEAEWIREQVAEAKARRRGEKHLPRYAGPRHEDEEQDNSGTQDSNSVSR